MKYHGFYRQQTHISIDRRFRRCSEGSTCLLWSNYSPRSPKRPRKSDKGATVPAPLPDEPLFVVVCQLLPLVNFRRLFVRLVYGPVLIHDRLAIGA